MPVALLHYEDYICRVGSHAPSGMVGCLLTLPSTIPTLLPRRSFFSPIVFHRSYPRHSRLWPHHLSLFYSVFFLLFISHLRSISSSPLFSPPQFGYFNTEYRYSTCNIIAPSRLCLRNVPQFELGAPHANVGPPNLEGINCLERNSAALLY
jgi:hypothetical protein